MQNKDHPSIKQARKYGDTVVLVVTVIIVGFLGFILADNLIVAFYGLIVIILLSLFYIRLYQISFLGSALRVQNGRLVFLKTITEEISTNLKMPYVDVFISQDPYLNAFSIGYMRPYTIVLHSAIVEQLTEQELRAILVHEMAHIKYHHTFINAYIIPMGQIIPVLGPAIAWLFNFWGRRAELAADRLAVAYTGDPHIVASALIKVHVGARFGEYMGEEGVLYQEKVSHGLLKLMAQSLQTHPFLVTRVHEIRMFAGKIGLQT